MRKPTSANKLLLSSPGTTGETLAANLAFCLIFHSNQNQCHPVNLGTVSVSSLAQTEYIHRAIREGLKKSLQAGKTRLNDTFAGSCGPSKGRSDAE